jgi:hypothetical protein
MAMSFLKNKGKGMFYEDYKGLFAQLNSNDEPSTMTLTRSDFRQSSNPFISVARAVYRNIKHSYDYLVARKIK